MLLNYRTEPPELSIDESGESAEEGKTMPRRGQDRRVTTVFAGCVSMLLIFGLGQSFGQTAPARLADEDFKDVRLDKSKPSIYLEFDKRGKRQPLREGEPAEGVWLRLHNNTKWTIYLSTFGVESSYGDVGLFYTVEPQSSPNTAIDSPIPRGYQPGHVSHVVNLEPGKFFLFSVPANHVAQGLR